MVVDYDSWVSLVLDTGTIINYYVHSIPRTHRYMRTECTDSTDLEISPL